MFSSQGVEEDISEALLIVNHYNLLLYNAAATSVALLLMLYALCELLAILFLCFKNRVKMLVFDRPSIFPLTLVFAIIQSTI